MKNITLNKALIGIGLSKPKRVSLNNFLKLKLPSFCNTKDFKDLFLPHLIIIGDSREKDNWIERKCEEVGIYFLKAKKDTKSGKENLKEGDYTFMLIFNSNIFGIFNYINRVAYERKATAGELYNNCQSEREAFENEFDRFVDKKYEKRVLLLEFGKSLIDLYNFKHEFVTNKGKKSISVGKTILSTIMSWKQPNNKHFEIIQNNDRNLLFWQMLYDMFYFWRNEVKNLYIKKMEEEKDGEK